MPLDEEQPSIPTPSTSFDAYQVSLQSAAVAATKCCMRLPKDLSYHRSLDRKFGKRLDACSNRILSITSHLIEYAEAGNIAEGASNTGMGKGKGKCRLESEEDVVDGFHSLVVDVMDQLLERTDICLDELSGRLKPAAIFINPESQSHTEVTKAPRGRLDAALANASHLPKPQLLFRSPVDNTNTATPWHPQLKTKHHAIVPLGQTLSIDSSVTTSHPYRYEITNLSHPAHLFNPPSSPTPPIPLASSLLTHITRVSQLPALLEALKQSNEIAIDLEHHSYRSFAGFVCLMQISTRTQDWIVDCLDPEIRAELECLNEIFANPYIVKVFHGAQSDIIWLQQDFNLYVVNLFDTYHATKVLDFPKHSLAALLEMLCDFTPDKRYQLADWRIRPLPEEMVLYAQSDTHFLLYIYDNLRNALIAPRSPLSESQSQAPLLEVLKRSAETALRTYVREVYDAINGTGAGGWDNLSRKWNRNSGVGGGVQASVFKAVHGWRDSIARSEDESTRYVLPNHYIFQLSERPPQDLPALLAAFQPVPPLVRTRSLELLDVIKSAAQRAAVQQTTTESNPTIVTRKEGDVRIAGAGSEGGKDLWDRLRPPAVRVTSSSALLGPALPSSYSSPSSSLFGPSARESASPSSRYQDTVARIHSTFVFAPSLPTSVVAPITASPTNPDTTMSHQDNSAAAVAEIPYIPPAERQTALKVDPNENDTLVVVGQRQKKRKRKDAKHEMSDLPVASDSMQQIAKPEVFDFESVPNILDEPTPVAVPSKKKRREKGGPKAGGIQHGNFGAPPRNMSEMKSGNQSRTFR